MAIDKKKKREQIRDQLMEMVDSGTATPSEVIRLYRKLLGKTQPEFATFQGVSHEAVRQIENNRGNHTIGLIEKMLRGSGLTIRIGRA